MIWASDCHSFYVCPSSCSVLFIISWNIFLLSHKTFTFIIVYRHWGGGLKLNWQSTIPYLTAHCMIDCSHAVTQSATTLTHSGFSVDRSPLRPCCTNIGVLVATARARSAFQRLAVTWSIRDTQGMGVTGVAVRWPFCHRSCNRWVVNSAHGTLCSPVI